MKVENAKIKDERVYKEIWIYIVLARYDYDYTVDKVYRNKEFAYKRVELLLELGIDTRICYWTIRLEEEDLILT